MKFLIVAAAILGVSMAGAPENRGKRGLVSSLGYGLGYDASLGLSSLHLPLASSVLSAPSISAISSPTVIKTVQTAPIINSHLPISTSVLSAPTVIKTVQTAPVVSHVVSQPQVLSVGSSLGLGSSLDLHSAGLLNSYNLGGIPVTGHVSDLYNLGGIPVTGHVSNVHAW
ncbi:uncharacterized protein LOC123684798 [Harmonia axyridis]|uniref:uncharacterized protein LOC123684798 n=1 Tax=Harmonia axyridis TaxID=115357 RepID=UPI001E2765A3|nr:uncharacterized protein LOC123684798 [Harmonia axyridis]